MIISSNDGRWDDYILKLPDNKRDIYFTRQYYQMEQRTGEGELFVFEDSSGNLGVYPYIKNKVKGIDEYYDIETAYGYGGPIINNNDSKFEKLFEQEFLAYCKRENIVAEFIRFHPLLKNEEIFKENIQVLHNRSTVWLDLREDLDSIWKNRISTQNRNIIRKCQKNQLHVEISDNYIEFREIYEETMKRVGAEAFYFFEKNYYKEIRQNPEYVLLRTYQGENTLAAAIFIGYGDYFHYHLSGSKKEFLKLSPNNFLLWEAIKYAKQTGYKKMHFGGGLKDSKEDSLFQFKSKFSNLYADFYIGKRVHNKEIYDMLIHKWEKKHGEQAKLLLQYKVE